MGTGNLRAVKLRAASCELRVASCELGLGLGLGTTRNSQLATSNFTARKLTKLNAYYVLFISGKPNVMLISAFLRCESCVVCKMRILKIIKFDLSDMVQPKFHKIYHGG